MSLFIKLLLLIIVIALAAPFVVEGPDGEPLMTLDKLQEPDAVANVQTSFEQMAGMLQGKDASEIRQAGKPAEKAKVYSWKDEQGNLHYSNIAPADGKEVKTVKVDPDMNVIKLDKDDPESVSRLPVPAPEELSEEQTGNPSMIRRYTPE